MRALYAQKGATLQISILESAEAQDFITAHAAVLDSAFQATPMSDAMRQRLQRSDYIFSGIKTFHELNEAFPLIFDSNGIRKPFEQFLKEVRNIHQTYNRTYLQAEYNFVVSSSTMAAKWEEFMKDGDRYNLQYRTAGDDRVRPEHAALHGVTLPPSDTFWEEYYPPNGWNCRCTVVQVRKSKFPTTPHDEAIALGELATQKDPKGIFHFNPGIQQKTFPDYNPYTIRRCRDCQIPKGNLNLAKSTPDYDICAACQLIHKLQKDNSNEESKREISRNSRKSLETWCKKELPTVKIGKSTARRFIVSSPDGDEIIINRIFYNETISKYKNSTLYPIKLEYAKKAHELIKRATLVNPKEESKDHHDAYFKVYEIEDDCYIIQMKVKCNADGNFMYIMRVFKK